MHNPHEIVVLADSGYDVKKIEQAIVRKNWKFIIALKKRGVSNLKEKTQLPTKPRDGGRWLNSSKVIAGLNGKLFVCQQIVREKSEWSFA